MSDFGFKVSLPGYDVKTATPEQCSTHSSYSCPKIDMKADPKHFGTINIYFANDPALYEDPANPLVLYSIPHNLPYTPMSLTVWKYTFPGDTVISTGTQGVFLNSSNDQLDFGTTSTDYRITLLRYSVPPSSVQGYSISLRYYIFAEEAVA